MAISTNGKAATATTVVEDMKIRDYAASRKIVVADAQKIIKLALKVSVVPSTLTPEQIEVVDKALKDAATVQALGSATPADLKQLPPQIKPEEVEELLEETKGEVAANMGITVTDPAHNEIQQALGAKLHKFAPNNLNASLSLLLARIYEEYNVTQALVTTEVTGQRVQEIYSQAEIDAYKPFLEQYADGFALLQEKRTASTEYHNQVMGKQSEQVEEIMNRFKKLGLKFTTDEMGK